VWSRRNEGNISSPFGSVNFMSNWKQILQCKFSARTVEEAVAPESIKSLLCTCSFYSYFSNRFAQNLRVVDLLVVYGDGEVLAEQQEIALHGQK
jgi:hypothetical protein